MKKHSDDIRRSAEAIDSMIDVTSRTEAEVDTYIRQAGFDPADVAKCSARAVREADRQARLDLLRERTEEWVREFVRAALSTGPGPLNLARTRGTRAAADSPNANARVAERRRAIELLADGRYLEAKDFLGQLLPKAQDPDCIRWGLAHALLGLGERERACEELREIAGSLRQEAEGRLNEIESYLRDL